MSHSILIKFCLVLGLILLPAGLARAQDFSFGDKNWSVAVNQTAITPQFAVRSSQTIAGSVQAAILGRTTAELAPLFGPDSVAGIEKITSEINQPAQNAAMIIDHGRATNFNPGQNGQSLNLYALLQTLQTPTEKIELPVVVSQPATKLAETNQLGIKELVAVGESNFVGSRHNRIVNITVGASKFDGVILQPGQEFSFNSYLGDIDAAHGFLPELVIKPEGVVPEFGGGLCQVSTTSFRAAMNAGLPITARRNHSFAVAYYAPQGTDATIYPGASDLKFTNDMATPVLIHTKVIGTKLYFEYYGTKDSRRVAFEGPVQYDKKSDGSMKATWTRHVTKNGETVTQVFKSTYVSPALYHRDTVVQASTPNPQSPPPTN